MLYMTAPIHPENLHQTAASREGFSFKERVVLWEEAWPPPRARHWRPFPIFCALTLQLQVAMSQCLCHDHDIMVMTCRRPLKSITLIFLFLMFKPLITQVFITTRVSSRIYYCSKEPVIVLVVITTLDVRLILSIDLYQRNRPSRPFHGLRSHGMFLWQLLIA